MLDKKSNVQGRTDHSGCDNQGSELKETPHHKQPITRQQALKQNYHSTLGHGTPQFLQESEDLRGERPQPAPATSKSAAEEGVPSASKWWAHD